MTEPTIAEIEALIERAPAYSLNIFAAAWRADAVDMLRRLAAHAEGSTPDGKPRCPIIADGEICILPSGHCGPHETVTQAEYAARSTSATPPPEGDTRCVRDMSGPSGAGGSAGSPLSADDALLVVSKPDAQTVEVHPAATLEWCIKAAARIEALSALVTELERDADGVTVFALGAKLTQAEARAEALEKALREILDAWAAYKSRGMLTAPNQYANLAEVLNAALAAQEKP